ncbi:hypothetical protein [Bacillus sp. C1]
MLNTIKSLLEGNNKKIKTVEAAQKELDKLETQVSDLQGKRLGVAQQIGEVENAVRIISANLVIDENDKTALASKEKGNRKLKNLQVELSEFDTKIADTQQQVLESKKELFRSQGEEARKNNVEGVKQQNTIDNLIKFFKAEDVYGSCLFRYVRKNHVIDLAQAYGLGDFQQINPVDQSFVFEANQEDVAKGKEKANEIVKEALEAMKTVLDKHDIELDEETVKRIENL